VSLRKKNGGIIKYFDEAWGSIGRLVVKTLILVFGVYWYIVPKIEAGAIR